MNIVQAKQQVKYAVEAYLARDGDGEYKIPLSRQRPVLLMGAPGIGKTAIMEQVAGELGIGLVSYSMTHHTRQSALGLPLIEQREFDGKAYEVSEYTMSEIIASVHEVMQRSGVRQGILFLDEVNCVSETLTPSMLQFLQYKTFGRHRVPDGWVIVTAGNPPEYNRSVHEFDVVTLDRVKRIDIEPDLEAWKPYAHEVGVHAAVLAFLQAKPGRFYSVQRGLAGREFVTARSWVDLSDAMKAYEELGFPVDGALIAQYLQLPELAEEFALYYELYQRYRSEYGIEGILDGRATEGTMRRARDAGLDERLSLLFALLDAVGSDMRACVQREDVLVALRDELRPFKEAALAAPELASALRAAADAHAGRLRAGQEAGSLSAAASAQEREVLAGLRACEEAARGGGATVPFEAVQRAYEQRVHALEADVAAASARLENLFAFVERALGDGPEVVVLVTELTARGHCARFISEHGSDAYFAHNGDLLVSTRAEQLRERICSLDLGAEG